MYFFGYIEKLSANNSFIFFTLVLFNSILYTILPLSFEPVIAVSSFYYFNKFGFLPGLILSVINLLLAFNTGSLLVMLATKSFVYPRIKNLTNNKNLFSILLDVGNECGVIFAILIKLTYASPFFSNCLLGLANISVTGLMISNFAIIPRYLSLIVYMFLIYDIENIKLDLIGLKSHPSHKFLFSSISFLSCLFLIGLLFRSYNKIKNRVPVSTQDDHFNMVNSEIV